MADPITQDHDLEDHIELLRKLDAVRKRSAELRDDGIEALIEWLQPPAERENPPDFGDWQHERSLVVRALLTRHDQPFGKWKDEKKRLDLINGLISQLKKDKDGDLTLKKLAENKLSVLVAASILRALVAQPGAAFSKTAMLCYYWIIRELYSADRSDWNIGGARAAPGGLVTAFTTSECIRALLSFADALRNTGNYIAEAGNYIARKEQLNALNNHYFPDQTPKPLDKWVEAEKDGLSLSCLLKFRRLSHYLVLALPSCQSEEATLAETYLQQITTTEFKKKLEGELTAAISNFDSALEDIVGYRKKEYEDKTNDGDCQKTLSTYEEGLYGSTKSDPSASSSRKSRKTEANVTRSASAHLIAFQAVQDARKRAKERLDSVTQHTQPDANAFKDICKGMQGGFDESAHKVENLLHPVRNYLSSVLDRELALASLGESWDSQPCELACAAASYGKLTKEWEKDARFDRAVSDLSKMISSRGQFANPRHIHEQPNGLRVEMSNAAALHAMAQLLHHACDCEIETVLADNMLRFFEDTRAGHSSNVWPYSASDIKPGLIEKLGDNNDKANHIREKLPPETQDLLKLAKSYPKNSDKGLPKAFSELLAKRLVKELNELVQAGPIDKDTDEEKNRPFSVEGACNRAKLNKAKMEQGEKYLCLLNRLCLQDAFPEGIRKVDVEQAVKQALSDRKGWDWEHSQPPLRANLTATARAVMALAKINEMLDTRINHIILEHFSVKEKNKGLDASLTLDSLFYPDYGLRLAPDARVFPAYPKGIKEKGIKEKDWPENGIRPQDSVAITLQRMRAHVSGVSLPEGDPLCSLVLHGPAGTGKTTLVEALAVSCDVRLVEVTPSDLVKYGEEDIEQRARAVFKALSMLTRTVILFDEFDPVLKRRKADSNKPLNVFSFLTPGMLPKLKDLNNEAKNRAVAYVLVTNLIGTLDEAAVRQGRFDERLGIYPPDLLSRAGRFLDQVHKDFIDETSMTFKPADVPWDRIVKIIKQTAGKGMTTLGKPGWFTIPDKKRKELKEKRGTPYHFLHLNKKDTGEDTEKLKERANLEWPEPDDELKGIRGEGRSAAKEWLQWTWINTGDEMLTKDADYGNLCQALQDQDSSSDSLRDKFAEKLADPEA